MSATPYRYCPLCRTELTAAERGGRERLVCPACGFTHWNNPVPVVGAIVERDGALLMVRSHGWPETWYGLVTGFLERGEHPEQAVLREVEEELGLKADLGEMIGIYPFERLNQIILVYHVRAHAGEVRLCAEELADWKAVPLAKVKPWPQGTGPALHKWLVSRGYQPEIAPFGTPMD
ncbi:MAG TPA: NUDIX domain-containing protein [Gammaproteobacteria bacterium]